MALSQAARPTKPERDFDAFLQGCFPGEWEYIGDGRKKIGGVNPDFVNKRGKKLIIELYGEYFHSVDDEPKRKLLFKNAGYNCLIVWTKEMGNPDALAQKVGEFLYGCS